MKLARVFGVLPVLVLTSKDNFGHSKGPIVWLPKKYTDRLYYHEMFHAKQFYHWAMYAIPLFAGIVGVLVFNMAPIYYAVMIAIGFVAVMFTVRQDSRSMSLGREIAAYGESVRHIPEESREEFIKFYARHLFDSGKYGSVSLDYIQSSIEHAVESKELFA
tara:strand:+ start:276 stop:758 length:483 start_codon:yes stop_codon:yes gene_type:complete